MSEERLPLGKCCTKCGEWRLLEEFGSHRSSPDGHAWRCKTCTSEYDRRRYQANRQRFIEKQRLWRENNAERAAEAKRRWREENPERESERKRLWREANKEHIAEWGQRYREENKEQIEVAQRRYREENRDKRRLWREENKERIQRWWSENKDKRSEYDKKRRARKSGAEGHHSVQEFRKLCTLYDNVCLCCGEVKPLTADHVVPLSQGGSDYIENIQPLCSLCNSTKSTKTIDYR